MDRRGFFIASIMTAPALPTRSMFERALADAAVARIEREMRAEGPPCCYDGCVAIGTLDAVAICYASHADWYRDRKGRWIDFVNERSTVKPVHSFTAGYVCDEHRGINARRLGDPFRRRPQALTAAYVQHWREAHVRNPAWKDGPDRLGPWWTIKYREAKT